MFVDAAYFIAVFRPDDQWKYSAAKSRQRLGDVTLVTTDEVLTEFLTSLSRTGSALRQRAADAVEDMMDSGSIRVIPQSRQSFLDGLARYKTRLDKGYSLQDCVSMNVMEAEGISQILTSDHNFEQEGFVVMMKRDRV